MNAHSENCDRTWLIGASRGMGKELAKLLTDASTQCLISARNQAVLKDASEYCNSEFFAFDATDKAQTRNACESVFERFRPNRVIINFGDYEPSNDQDVDIELYERLILTNYLACVYLSAELIPRLRNNGGGTILFNVSAASYRGLPGGAPYGASKAALLHLAEALHPVAARDNIQIRVINPGFVQSRLTRKNRFKMPFLLTEKQAAKR
ncbi:MAG: SDR family NAD(P)-dependent oxidoreductase, partial [bacterium]